MDRRKFIQAACAACLSATAVSLLEPAISNAWMGDGDCVPDETHAGRTINASKTKCFGWIAMSLVLFLFRNDKLVSSGFQLRDDSSCWYAIGTFSNLHHGDLSSLDPTIDGLRADLGPRGNLLNRQQFNIEK